MAVVLGSAVQAAGADGAHHPHHLGASTGALFQDDKTSAFLGLEYSYRFQNGFGLLVFAEEARGDTDLEVFGVGVMKFFDNGFKVAVGPGWERKIKQDKTLALLHVSAGYDWHRGNWSFGPFASIDFIENNHDAYYLGFAVGVGF